MAQISKERLDQGFKEWITGSEMKITSEWKMDHGEHKAGEVNTERVLITGCWRKNKLTIILEMTNIDTKETSERPLGNGDIWKLFYEYELVDEFPEFKGTAVIVDKTWER